jgi:hypothetical protein
MTVVNTTSARTVGDRVKLNFTINGTTSGTPTDSDITVIVQPPAGDAVVAVSTSTASTGVNHSAAGTYDYSFTTTGAGDYEYWMRSTGAVTVSTGGRIAVRGAYASS